MSLVVERSYSVSSRSIYIYMYIYIQKLYMYIYIYGGGSVVRFNTLGPEGHKFESCLAAM